LQLDWPIRLIQFRASVSSAEKLAIEDKPTTDLMTFELYFARQLFWCNIAQRGGEERGQHTTRQVHGFGAGDRSPEPGRSAATRVWKKSSPLWRQNKLRQSLFFEYFFLFMS